MDYYVVKLYKDRYSDEYLWLGMVNGELCQTEKQGAIVLSDVAVLSPDVVRFIMKFDYEIDEISENDISEYNVCNDILFIDRQS